jgi:hypothetical protein
MTTQIVQFGAPGLKEYPVSRRYGSTVASDCSWPYGPLRSASGQCRLLSHPSAVVTPDLQSEATVAAQQANPQATVGMNFLNNYQNFVDILKGPGHQSDPTPSRSTKRTKRR